jgi:hypothetical protein
MVCGGANRLLEAGRRLVRPSGVTLRAAPVGERPVAVCACTAPDAGVPTCLPLDRWRGAVAVWPISRSRDLGVVLGP